MKIFAMIQQLDDVLHPLLQGWSVLAAVLLVEVSFTFRSGFLQFTHCELWFKNTPSKLFSQNSRGRDGISPLQAVSIALAGLTGTGDIVGVTTALILGGAGAVFWMWISAFLGMMTIFSENTLGMKHRIKNSDGTWLDDAMYCLERGIYSKVLAVLFSTGCVLVSLGMGNMAQSNFIAGAPQDAPGVAPPVIGLALAALLAIMIFGGTRRIARVTERSVPSMAISHLLTMGIVLYRHRQALPEVFRQIMDEAFGLRQAVGGIGGAAVANALKTDVPHGVFVNKAGLSSSITVHSGNTLKELVEQGTWGIFQMFLDTIIMCTVTALVILCNDTSSNGKDGAALSATAFSSVFGNYGGTLIPVYISLPVFATLLGWSYYDECGVRCLVGNRAVPAYRILLAPSAIAGCTLDLHLVQGISDIFSSLMALPNLIALPLLSGEVLDETTNYSAKCRQEEKAEGKRRPFARIRYSYSSHNQKYENNKSQLYL